METAKLVTFGRGGDTVYYSANSRCEGHGSPEQPHAARCDDGRTIPDGCPVIDMLPAVQTAEGVRWVIRGPMVNVDLPDGEISRCPQPSDLLASALVAAGGELGVLLVLQAGQRANGQQPGPLDSVSVDDYVRGWRAVGARIGRYLGDQIVWE